MTKLRSNPPRIGAARERLDAGGSWRSGKQSSTARGYGYEWQQYRIEYLIAHPLCAIRGEGCTLAATVVDHVVPHRGDMSLFWNPANHQAVCNHCHSKHKQRQEARDNR